MIDSKKVARELVAVAKDLMAADTFKCPDCGSKVLEQTGYCVKCQKKVKKAADTFKCPDCGSKVLDQTKYCVKCKKKVKKARERISITMPTIMDMDIHLGQMGTTYVASSRSFSDRYDGKFKANFSGQGSTPHKALDDLMDGVYRYFTKQPRR